MNDQTIYESLLGLRMPIFMEIDSFSNRYHQINFTKEEYKKITAFLYTEIMKTDKDGKYFDCSDDEIVLPDKPDRIWKKLE